jgi:hypothetical protein
LATHIVVVVEDVDVVVDEVDDVDEVDEVDEVDDVNDGPFCGDPPENAPPPSFTFIVPTFAKLVGLAQFIVVQ